MNNFLRNNRVVAVAREAVAYYKRSRKAGGGSSRYCYSSCISVEMGKVLSYKVSCKNCSNCSKYKNLLSEDC